MAATILARNVALFFFCCSNLCRYKNHNKKSQKLWMLKKITWTLHIPTKQSWFNHHPFAPLEVFWRVFHHRFRVKFAGLGGVRDSYLTKKLDQTFFLGKRPVVAKKRAVFVFFFASLFSKLPWHILWVVPLPFK